MLNERSWSNLAGVDPRLSAVAALASLRGPLDFVVTEGLRSQQRQAELFRAGKSWTLNSKHLHGQAMDLAVIQFGRAVWDIQTYRELWEWQVRPAAAELGVKLIWGGDWKQVDGVHFELP